MMGYSNKLFYTQTYAKKIRFGKAVEERGALKYYVIKKRFKQNLLV